jgi:hypothetical protein
MGGSPDISCQVPLALGREVRLKPAAGGLYPHFHGPSNVGAVMHDTRVIPDPDGLIRIDPRETLRASVRRHRRVPQPGRARNRRGAPPTWLSSDSRRRRWRTRRKAPHSIETRNKIPDCVSRWWNETKKKIVLFAWGWKRPRSETLPVALA